eukprot:5804471-Pyramimonas_sp.AAC.1
MLLDHQPTRVRATALGGCPGPAAQLAGSGCDDDGKTAVGAASRVGVYAAGSIQAMAAEAAAYAAKSKALAREAEARAIYAEVAAKRARGRDVDAMCQATASDAVAAWDQYLQKLDTAAMAYAEWQTMLADAAQAEQALRSCGLRGPTATEAAALGDP